MFSVPVSARALHAAGGARRTICDASRFSSPPYPANASLRTRCPIILILFAVILLVAPMRAHAQTAPEVDAGLTSELMRREADLIHLINLTRRAHGAPPLRWNRELSEAVRWFAADSVVGGSGPTCDHNDSLGRGPGTRMRAFGYNNPAAYAQLLVCGFAEPAGVVHGWLSDPADNYYQKQMLLNPAFREIGAGYYLNMDLTPPRGLVAAQLAADAAFAPVVIENEAPATTSPAVTLYIYPTAQTPVEIKVSNDAHFANAAWEPYVTEKPWQLVDGTGWRTVYVLTRDVNGRTSLASDTIYLGAELPSDELSLEHATNIGVGYRFAALPATANERVRFSMNWGIDSGDPAVLVYRGTGETVADDGAIGGSALHLRAADQDTVAQAVLADVPADYLLTAYFRLKTADNLGPAEVARISVMADGRQFGPREIAADEFAAAREWQEFGLNFVLPEAALDRTVAVRIERTGQADLWLDAVRIFSQALPVTPDLVWALPGMGNRNQGIQARLESSNGLGEVFDVGHTPVDSEHVPTVDVPAVDPEAAALVFWSRNGHVLGQDQVVLVCSGACAAANWTAQSNAPWLHFIKAHEGLLVYVDATELPKGEYFGTINLLPLQAADAQTGAQPAQVQTWVSAQLRVEDALRTLPVEQQSVVWLPMTRK